MWPTLPDSERIPRAAEDFRQAGRHLSVTLCGSSQTGSPPLNEEIPMKTAGSNNSIENDVLHLGSQSKLSPEEIAKALAHHNRHHSGDQPKQAAAKTSGGKKSKLGK